ncbi:flagellar biosynthesis protein FlhA [Sandaracinus amylolyticus]|uniref:Flagellar biosynthesis protein FlhA n=1 Tax=Sandaracinus amylolyticus TaxID=927083 RepID=A0A0F6W5A3_9BACT|nr:flagellar biosynthesis protein FlhA [Sandaracinus amylolyticus]AKF07843.1 Flagellar biosynthesis protein FlhA [Sandaracinus amylolyticus]
MPAPTTSSSDPATVRRYADAGLALLVVLIVGMMIVPLPTPLLDVLLAGNVSLAIVILLVAMYVPDALAFTSFPTILLITTLFRLALNVSSTRLILLQADAGEVIRAFGDFVVQGNYVVGAVVFLILTLIQFMVIARGSERVAEVGARFALDAMPGKQMAIDADLRSGALGHDEARRRRRLLQRESQFYGAMDGAMKFVKGDAIAGIVITGVNIVFGVVIGVAMHDMGALESLQRYGLLTIGDGLVSQIPSLLISTAAGLVVTRVASEDEQSSLGGDVGRQIFGNPRALAIASGFLVLLAIVPGLPPAPFVVLAAVFGGVAWRLSRRAPRVDVRDVERSPRLVPITIELGAALAAGLDGLLERDVPALRDRLFASLGVVLPEVRAHASSTLAPRDYAIHLHEIPVARGELADDELVAILERAVRRRAADLVGLQEVQSMLDQLERTHPALVRHVVPKPIALPLLADVLRRLVDEGVSIRPLREILEALATATATDPAALADSLRVALRRHLTHAHADGGVLEVLVLDPEIEETLRDGLQRSGALALPPSTARDVVAVVRRAVSSREGRVPPLLTQPDVRRALRRLLEVELPDVAVLAYTELDPAVTVKTVGRVAL